MGKRAITVDTDRRERLIQLIASKIPQTELGGTFGEKAALFTYTLLRFAKEMIPGQIRLSRLSGLFEVRQYTANLKEPGRRGKRLGRRCVVLWPAALLFARCGRHAKNSGK